MPETLTLRDATDSNAATFTARRRDVLVSPAAKGGSGVELRRGEPVLAKLPRGSGFFPATLINMTKDRKWNLQFELDSAGKVRSVPETSIVRDLTRSVVEEGPEEEPSAALDAARRLSVDVEDDVAGNSGSSSSSESESE